MGPNFLVINPDTCIDCHVCVSECPASAIYPGDTKVVDIILWTEINTRLSKKWPVINKKVQALPEAGKWNGIKNKIKYLEE
jgi:ferredoxin